MRALAITLFVAISLPFVGKFMGVADYVISYERYVHACENTDRQEMQCNGTCQWVKENAQDVQDLPNPPAVPESLNTELSPFTSNLLAHNLKPNIDTHTIMPLAYMDRGLWFVYFDVPTPPPNAVLI
jgi:hypothetical protein